MIKEFINKKIDDFFLEQDRSLDSSSGYIKSCKRWQKDFRRFAEDIFRKWQVSRSGLTVHQLLDNGLNAAEEQIVVQELENASTSFFSVQFNAFERSIFMPVKLLGITIALWTVLFGILLGKTTDIVWILAWTNFWFAGICLFSARMLFLISKRVLEKKSCKFIEHFFDDAEREWTKIQEQHNAKNKGLTHDRSEKTIL